MAKKDESVEPIGGIPPLSMASKTHTIEGLPAIDEDPPAYAIAYAASIYPKGCRISQWIKAVEQGWTIAILEDMIEKGLIAEETPTFEGKDIYPKYTLTEKGRLDND